MKRTTLMAASALVWAATAVLASVPGEGPPPAAEGTTYLGGAEMTYELFERTIEKNPGAVVTEYSWDATSCDPCPEPPPTIQTLSKSG